MEEEILERVRSIVADQFGIDQNRVTAGDSFVDDLQASSLDEIELIMAFEDAFDIALPDAVAETIITVQDAADHIKQTRKELRRLMRRSGKAPLS